MGRTFRRNEGRRPKWDKSGAKSRKLREFEEEKFKHRSPPPSFLKTEIDPEPPEIPDYT